MEFLSRIPWNRVVIHSVLSAFLTLSVDAKAAGDPNDDDKPRSVSPVENLEQSSCEEILSIITPVREPGFDVHEDVARASLISALVIVQSDLGQRFVEFLRLRLRGLSGQDWELAIYGGTTKDAATVYRRLRRWLLDVDSSLESKVYPSLYVGARRLKKIAIKMETNPFLSDLILKHGRFGILRPLVDRSWRVENAPKFSNLELYSFTVKNLEKIESELARRHLTSDALQLVVSADGEVKILNPEILRRGTHEELKSAMKRSWLHLRGLRP